MRGRCIRCRDWLEAGDRAWCQSCRSEAVSVADKVATLRPIIKEKVVWHETASDAWRRVNKRKKGR